MAESARIDIRLVGQDGSRPAQTAVAAAGSSFAPTAVQAATGVGTAALTASAAGAAAALPAIGSARAAVGTFAAVSSMAESLNDTLYNMQSPLATQRDVAKRVYDVIYESGNKLLGFAATLSDDANNIEHEIQQGHWDVENVGDIFRGVVYDIEQLAEAFVQAGSQALAGVDQIQKLSHSLDDMRRQAASAAQVATGAGATIGPSANAVAPTSAFPPGLGPLPPTPPAPPAAVVPPPGGWGVGPILEPEYIQGQKVVPGDYGTPPLFYETPELRNPIPELSLSDRLRRGYTLATTQLGNMPIDAYNNNTDALKDLAKKIPGATILADILRGPAGALIAGGYAVNKIRQFSNEFDTSLGQYSPDIITQRARDEIKAIRQRLEQSERIGGVVSDFSEAQNNVGRAISDLKSTAVELLAPILTMAANSAATGINVTNFVERFGVLHPELMFFLRTGGVLKNLLDKLTKGDDDGGIAGFMAEEHILPRGFWGGTEFVEIGGQRAEVEQNGRNWFSNEFMANADRMKDNKN